MTYKQGRVLRTKGRARVDMTESTVRYRIEKLTSKVTGKIRERTKPWNELGTQERRSWRIREREELERRTGEEREETC